METKYSRYLNWEGTPTKLSEFTSFRKAIKEFKKVGVHILEKYEKPIELQGTEYLRFAPSLFDSGDRTNIGLFSTASCLETIALYRKDLKVPSNLNKYLTPVERNSHIRHIFKFLLLGLVGHFNDPKRPQLSVSPKDIMCFSCLTRAGTFLNITGNKRKIFECEDIKETFIKALNNIRLVKNINDYLKGRKDNRKLRNMHPFILYKFLIFMKNWDNQISLFGTGSDLKSYEEKSFPTFHQCFRIIYPLAKYELYRQMALKLSGDMALFDVKRFIYSLLIVYIDGSFSNNLVRDQALRLIFEAQRKDVNAVWPTGQLLALSYDSFMSVSTVESAYDLIECNALKQQVIMFLPELKAIFDCIARTIQYDKEAQNEHEKMKGWYPLDQRDKSPVSWYSSLCLGFIKSFCNLLTVKINTISKEYFYPKHKTPTIEWRNIWDASAVKSKLRLMFDKTEEDIVIKKKTAILFGPPGTGKTTYGRGLANELGWDFLELTPGDFFSGNVGEVLNNINAIFENLMHIERTVVFIDEIDDLVRSRGESSNFDPRIYHVNTLLPRFQNLHDHGQIILLMATNNYHLVDEAISRMGRIDFIIPVGAMSIHGRLKLLVSFLNLRKDNFSEIFCKKNISLIIDFLQNTKYLSYADIIIYLEKLASEWDQSNDRDFSKVQKSVDLYFEINRSVEDRPLYSFAQYNQSGHYIFEKDGHIFNGQTRPISGAVDFLDIDDLNTDDRNKIIDLFILFQQLSYQNSKDYSLHCSKIKTIVIHFANPKYYGIITSFQDDLDSICSHLPPNPDLTESKNILNGLIQNRRIKSFK